MDYNNTRKRQANETDQSDREKRLKRNEEEQCSICLEQMNKSYIGSPKSCGHFFCLSCLKKWSKRQNACPLCRTPYRQIRMLNRRTKKLIRRIPAPRVVRETDDSVEILYYSSY
ncbi:unnamed protein product [Ceutorhynchus assimilis]|uniref:RING-type domain-containing protein n=1 Tax=Ceutorhynchus assimilis TaxID=467358 RepID=A0A9N9MDZ1_9CUCU|nr:unnamed protein product [Ceutorhynchus assimilis]